MLCCDSSSCFGIPCEVSTACRNFPGDVTTVTEGSFCVRVCSNAQISVTECIHDLWLTMEECLQTAVLHIQQLNCLCRICGSRSKKFCFDRKALLCTLHTDAIRIHHDLGISHGKRSHHSETICRKCYMCLAKLKKTDSEHTAQTAKYGIGKSFSMWTKPTVFTRFLP